MNNKRFGKHNPFYGKHHSEETLKKIREKRKKYFIDGGVNPFKGRHHSIETKQRISEKLKGRKHQPRSDEYRKNLSISKMGHEVSVETRKKLSDTHKGEKSCMFGKSKTKEVRDKISQTLLNHTVTDATRKKMSDLKLERYKDKTKHPSWKGGISSEPYSVDWTDSLKISIRERDKYTCRLCGKRQGDIAFHIHHIDYNKKNCNPDNLITLCNSCHAKTSHNRESWIKYFNNKIYE